MRKILIVFLVSLSCCVSASAVTTLNGTTLTITDTSGYFDSYIVPNSFKVNTDIYKNWYYVGMAFMFYSDNTLRLKDGCLGGPTITEGSASVTCTGTYSVDLRSDSYSMQSYNNNVAKREYQKYLEERYDRPSFSTVRYSYTLGGLQAAGSSVPSRIPSSYNGVVFKTLNLNNITCPTRTITVARWDDSVTANSTITPGTIGDSISVYIQKGTVTATRQLGSTTPSGISVGSIESLSFLSAQGPLR